MVRFIRSTPASAGQALPVGPRMVWLGEPVLDVVGLADHVEAHLAGPGDVAVARLPGELDAVVGQDGVDAVGYGFQQVFEELPCCPAIGLVNQLRDGELAGAINADEQVELAFGGLLPKAISMWKKPIG